VIFIHLIHDDTICFVYHFESFHFSHSRFRMILRQLLTAVTYSAEALETERDKIIIVHDNVLFYTLIILSEILKINQQYYVKCRGKNAQNQCTGGM
ncbi:MAG: hypothetical protein K0R19_3631, partial [Bacillota bacterium]|nr:hypothetical protein [Bacillota bacterium]